MTLPSLILQQTAVLNMASSSPTTQLTATNIVTPPQAVAAHVDGQRPVDDKMANKAPKRGVNDFIFGKVIGEGSYSTVYLAKDIHTNRQYAIKAYEKLQVIKERKSELIRREKEAMNILNNSGSNLFTKLSCTFQDRGRLFFVMSHAKNCDMLPFINRGDLFNMACTRFYSAEILLALEHLHGLNIQHRDLKPENILLDENMHIKVTDFGCCKIVNMNDKRSSRKKRANTFVGTAQYVSPEVLADKPSSFSSDLWALGCIIYQMIAGYPPFRSRTEYLVFKRILKGAYYYPNGFHAGAADLIKKLLVLDPNERLGIKDAKRYMSIRSHSFYNGLDFDSLPMTNSPLMRSFLGKNQNNYHVPDHLEPGLSHKQLTRLLIDDELNSCSFINPISSVSVAAVGQSGQNIRGASANPKKH